MSEQDTPTTSETTEETTSATTEGGQTFTQADLDRVVADRLARERKKAVDKYKDYDDLKSKAERLSALEQESMSAQEKAVTAARQEARTEALREVASRLVDAKFEALAAGRTVNGKPLDVAAILEGVNRAYYLDETSLEVDSDKVTRFLDGIAPKVEETKQETNSAFPDLGQGRRTPGKGSKGEIFTSQIESLFR